MCFHAMLAHCTTSGAVVFTGRRLFKRKKKIGKVYEKEKAIGSKMVIAFLGNMNFSFEQKFQTAKRNSQKYIFLKVNIELI